MNKNKIFIGFFVLILTMILNSSADAQTGARQHMRGKIASVKRANASDKDKLLATIFVKKTSDSESTIDKAYLLITPETKIYEQNGDVVTDAKLSDIKKGVVILAHLSNAPTIMIYPMRIAATEIIIMREGARPKGK